MRLPERVSVSCMVDTDFSPFKRITMSDLILIFEGTDSESQILKHQLEAAGIPSMSKSEANSAAIAGFGSFASSKVYVSSDNHGKASEIVKTFQA